MNAAAFRNPAFLASATLLLASSLGLSAAVSGLRYHLRKEPIEVALKVQSVPTQARHWQQVGHDSQMPQAVVDELGTTNYLSRFYQRKPEPGKTDRPSLELHLAYYTGMVDTVPHVPERCMVGGGWDIYSSAGLVGLPLDRSAWQIDSDASADGRTIYKGRLSSGLHARLPAGIENAKILVTEFIQPSSGKRMFAGYFFVANGGICARAEDVRLLAFDLKSRYAFYLKVQVSSFEIESAEVLASEAASLLDDLLPEIMLCVPDWTEVERGNYPPKPGVRPVADRSETSTGPGPLATAARAR